MTVDITHMTSRQRHHPMDERPIQPEKPRAEPEIIPPDRDDLRPGSGAARVRLFVGGDGPRHIVVTRLGPLGIFLLALMILILFALILVLVLGFVLIWVPLVALLVAAAIVASF